MKTMILPALCLWLSCSSLCAQRQNRLPQPVTPEKHVEVMARQLADSLQLDSVHAQLFLQAYRQQMKDLHGRLPQGGDPQAKGDLRGMRRGIKPQLPDSARSNSDKDERRKARQLERLKSYDKLYADFLTPEQIERLHQLQLQLMDRRPSRPPRGYAFPGSEE